ncbi:MAG: FtsW/RodA/SpoVE family cell cycle protein [Bacilli bacterium]
MLKKLDKTVLITATILFVIGLLMIFSASNVTAFMKYGAAPYRFFIKQLIFLTISVFGGIVLIHFKTKTYYGWSNILLVVMTVFLIFVLLFSEQKNQASSWANFKGMGIQPSEFIKVVMIVWIPCYYNKFKNKLNNLLIVLIPVVIIGFISILIYSQPDLGTTIIFLALCFLMFIAIPFPKEMQKKLFKLAGIGILFLLSMVLILKASGKDILLTRQLERFNYFNPCGRFITTGNQICNGYIAINNGGLLGEGLGNSTQKYLYLPEAHTDFIFAIIMEELGLIASLGIIILYIILLARIIYIARGAKNNRNALICYGVAIYIFLHIFVNLSGLYGLLPMTGVPLPFMSYGGSFTLSLVMALTLVQRVYIENNK